MFGVGFLVGLVWPSLLSMLFLVLAGMGTAKEVVGQGFGSEIVLLIIFFSVFTKWLEDIGLTNTMAKWLLSRKFLVGKPYVFIFMFIFGNFYLQVSCMYLCNHFSDVGDLLSTAG